MGDKNENDFEASNEWPIEAVLTLEAWKKQLGFRMGAHLSTQRSYKKCHKCIKLPLLVLSGILGATALTSALSETGSEWGTITKIATFIFAIAVIILTAINESFTPQTLGERHKVASNVFESIIRTVNQIIVLVGGLHTTYKPSPYVTLNNVREQIDNAIAAAPGLPKKFDSSLSSFDLVKLIVKERKKRLKKDAKMSQGADDYQEKIDAGMEASMSVISDQDSQGCNREGSASEAEAKGVFPRKKDVVIKMSEEKNPRNDSHSSKETLLNSSKKTSLDSKHEDNVRLSFEMISGRLVPIEVDPTKQVRQEPQLNVKRLIQTPENKAEEVMANEQRRMSKEQLGEIERLNMMRKKILEKR